VVVPVRVEEEPLLGAGVLRAGDLVADPDSAPRVAHSVLARTFGLTAAEVRGAALLARGCGVDDICDCFAVSANTVRTPQAHLPQDRHDAPGRAGRVACRQPRPDDGRLVGRQRVVWRGLGDRDARLTVPGPVPPTRGHAESASSRGRPR
jgi:hypothetical protein